MKLFPFLEPFSSGVPKHYLEFLLPDFSHQCYETKEGTFFSQGLMTETYSIWKIDTHLERELTVDITDDKGQLAFFLPRKGEVAIPTADGCYPLYKNHWAILDLSGQARFYKGRSSFWITTPNGDYYQGLEPSLKGHISRTAALEASDVELLDNQLQKKANTYQERYVREARLLWLYGRILEAVQSGTAIIDELSAIQVEALELKAYLDGSFQKNINFAKLKCYPRGKAAFFRIFNCNPAAYLQQLRIVAARKLLADSHLSVKHIAWEVGYLSEAAFSRAFSSTTGIPPTTYRKLAKEK